MPTICAFVRIDWHSDYLIQCAPDDDWRLSPWSYVPRLLGSYAAMWRKVIVAAARLSGNDPLTAARAGHRIAGKVVGHPGALMAMELLREAI